MLWRWSSLWYTDGVGGVGGAMTSCALCKMKDVVMLKMLKMLRGWRCCCVEVDSSLKVVKMLLCWKCCYVEDFEDVAALKMLEMLLRWSCRCHTEQQLQNGVVDSRLEKKDAHFAYGSLEDNDISRSWNTNKLQLWWRRKWMHSMYYHVH